MVNSILFSISKEVYIYLCLLQNGPVLVEDVKMPPMPGTSAAVCSRDGVCALTGNVPCQKRFVRVPESSGCAVSVLRNALPRVFGASHSIPNSSVQSKHREKRVETFRCT